MGKCRYCRGDAGFLRFRHRECHSKHLAALGALPRQAMQLLESDKPKSEVFSALQKTMDDGFVKHSPEYFLNIGWGLLLDKYLADGCLTLKEDDYLMSRTEQLNLDHSKFSAAWQKRSKWIFDALPGIAMELIESNLSKKDVYANLANWRDRANSNIELTHLLCEGWSLLLDRYLNDGVLTEGEDELLTSRIQQLDLDPQDFSKAWTTRSQALILRQIFNGVIPSVSPGVTFVDLPFTLGKNENVIWAWRNVRAYEERTRRSYVGGSHGVSVRIVKGVYYRAGSFKGHPVDHQYQHDLGSGPLAFTNKHLLWSGSKAIRIPWKKVVAVQGYSDGLGVQRDAASAKPLLFVAGDGEGWFLKNLAENLPSLV